MNELMEKVFDSVSEEEAELLLEGTEVKTNRITARRIARRASEKAGLRTRRAGAGIGRRGYIALAVCFAVLMSLGVGTYAYAAEAEYNKAVEYFEDHWLPVEGLTKAEVRTVYRDVTSNSFTSRTTAEYVGVITSQTAGNYTPDELRSEWNSMVSQTMLSKIRVNRAPVTDTNLVIEPADGTLEGGASAVSFCLPNKHIYLSVSNGRILPYMSGETAPSDTAELYCWDNGIAKAVILPDESGELAGLTLVRAVFAEAHEYGWDAEIAGCALIALWGPVQGENPHYEHGRIIDFSLFDGVSVQVKRGRARSELYMDEAQMLIDASFEELLCEALDGAPDPRTRDKREAALEEWLEQNPAPLAESFEEFKTANAGFYEEVYLTSVNLPPTEDEERRYRDMYAGSDYRYFSIAHPGDESLWVPGQFSVNAPGCTLEMTCDNMELGMIAPRVGFIGGFDPAKWEGSGEIAVYLDRESEAGVDAETVENATVRILFKKEGRVVGYAMVCFWNLSCGPDNRFFNCVKTVKSVEIKDGSITEEEANARLDRAYLILVENCGLFGRNRDY